MFTVTKITVDKNGKQTNIEGLYVGKEHIGVCPITGRLIADKNVIGEQEICDHCSHPIDVKSKGKFINI